MLCGVVKSKFTTDADGETEKRPLIHSKNKTIGCVIFVLTKIKKCKLMTFGSDFGNATFRTILAKRFWDTSSFTWFCMEFAAYLRYTLKK